MTEESYPNELPSDARKMASAYDEVLAGVRVCIQWVGDDQAYYAWAFWAEDGREIGKVGPYKEMKRALGKIGQTIRAAGYWGDQVR